MLDKRMETFLELCTVMNYHQTAANLSMTQPAVTQHIHYLEELYGCQLFHYRNRTLSKTDKCMELEQYARSITSLHLYAMERMQESPKIPLRLGATKTIGEYLLDDLLPSLLGNPCYEVSITIDNTATLLERLDHFQLDVLLLEGYVDKASYLYTKLATSKIVGICSPSHPFAGRQVHLKQLLDEPIILREEGSGTRAVLEAYLISQGYSTNVFSNLTILNHNGLLVKAVEQNLGISFVYELIPRKQEKIATFTIKGSNLIHEFNYVYLNQAKADTILPILHCIDSI